MRGALFVFMAAKRTALKIYNTSTQLFHLASLVVFLELRDFFLILRSGFTLYKHEHITEKYR